MKDQTVLQGLDKPRLSLEQIAAELKIAKPALEKYREGKRKLPPDFRPKLAGFLRAHAADLLRIAADLDADHARADAQDA